jgi:hypothetical protein
VQSSLFNFHRNHPFLKTTVVHFQLRNLLWATTGHDVYAVHNNAVKRYNVVTKDVQTVIDLSGSLPEHGPPAHAEQVFVSTACAAHALVAAGAPPNLETCASNLMLLLYEHCKASI